MTCETESDLWGLVLAGGDGMRLQPLTRQLTGTPIPKQYCRLAGDRSLLEATLARVAPLISPTRTLAIVNRDHLPLARPQLPGLPAPNVLVQPRNLDTGPGLLFGLLHLARRDPNAAVVVLPSDHYIRDDRPFLAHVAQAFDLVQTRPDRIVLLGMAPDRADSGLGYLEIERRPSDPGHHGAFHVLAFVEKPSPEQAERIIRRGALWNSFVMLFRVETMISLLRRRRASDYAALRRLDDDAYAAAAPWNFSRDFLAHIPEELLALPVADVGWSDWGTPEAVERTLRDLHITPPWRAAVATA
jgi:mannose-1-phosphate guanylyltransferase